MLLYMWMTNQQLLVAEIFHLGNPLKILTGLKNFQEQKLAFEPLLGIMDFDEGENVFALER